MCSRALPVNGDGNIEVRRHADELQIQPGLRCGRLPDGVDDPAGQDADRLRGGCSRQDGVDIASALRSRAAATGMSPGRSCTQWVLMTIADVRPPAQLFAHAARDHRRRRRQARIRRTDPGARQASAPARHGPRQPPVASAAEPVWRDRCKRVAAAAFGVFYSSIWMMADATSALRLTAVSIVAVVGHDAVADALQRPERPRDLDHPEERQFTTLRLPVSHRRCDSMYVALFVVVVSGAMIIIPPAHLESTLGHDTRGATTRAAGLAGQFARHLAGAPRLQLLESDHAPAITPRSANVSRNGTRALGRPRIRATARRAP